MLAYRALSVYDKRESEMEKRGRLAGTENGVDLLLSAVASC